MVIVSDVDALCATLVSCGARCRLILESLADSGGQYWCVLSGHVVHGDRRFGPRSLGWCGPGASMPEMRAGADGARLLVMRFPKPINIETDPAADVALSGERTAKEVFLP